MRMHYETLADVLQKMVTLGPRVVQYNCEKRTLEWIKKTFQTPLQGFEMAYSGLFGTPVYEAQHLQYGFIEAEMSDGTRKIINLNKDAERHHSTNNDTENNEMMPNGIKESKDENYEATVNHHHSI